jgi:hypothetical protein
LVRDEPPADTLDETPARETRAHQEHEHLRHDTGDQDAGSTPINLRLHTRLMTQRHEHLIDRLAQRAPTLTNIAADLALQLTS